MEGNERDHLLNTASQEELDNAEQAMLGCPVGAIHI